MKKKISIFFLIIFILTIISVIVLKTQNNQIEGDALSGYKSSGRYYFKSNGNIIEVSKMEWYKNFFIWVITFIFWGLSGIGIIYFIITYGFPFVFKLTRDTRST